jgi:rare lipoprotein A
LAALLFMCFSAFGCASTPKGEPRHLRKRRVASARRTTTASKKTPASSRPYNVMGKWYYPKATAHGYREVGNASWYGPKFHGKHTASGERFNMYRLTAAHRTLPLGTYVRVSHLKKDKSVVVKVNDRGPFVGNRIIDLSLGAARNIDMIGEGVARVRVEVLGYRKKEKDRAGKTRVVFVPKESYTTGEFAVQVASFKDPANAKRFRESILERFPGASIVKFSRGDETFYRVQAVVLQNLDKARQEAHRLGRKDFPGAFAVAVDEPAAPKGSPEARGGT